MEQPGPTGEFPKGHLNKDDEGELAIGFRVKGDLIIINFGKKVKWIGLRKEEAISIANMLLKKAKEL